MAKKIVCLFKGARKERLPLVPNGLVPADFFYGVLGLNKKKYEITIVENNLRVISIQEKIFNLLDLISQAILKLGINRLRLNHLKKYCYNKQIIISFSDGLSLTLGNLTYLNNIKKIGCFHCLSDLDKRAPFFLRKYSHNIIKKSST